MRPLVKANTRTNCPHSKPLNTSNFPLPLKSERRKRTKHESIPEHHKHLSRNALSTFIFSQDTKAGQCIKHIEKELILLKRLTVCNNKESINKIKEQFTQTADGNFNHKGDFVNMKLNVVQMKERMEELEILYKKDGMRTKELEQKIEEVQEELVNARGRAEKYKVFIRLISRLKLYCIRKKVKSRSNKWKRS
jgi:hypothetical protein